VTAHGSTGGSRRGWLAAGSSAVLALAVTGVALASGPAATATGGHPVDLVAATPAPTDVGAAPLLPNLHARRATQVHVVVHGSTRRLRFASALANVGAGPLELVRRPANPCPSGQLGMDQAVYQDHDANGSFRRGTDTGRVFRVSGCMHTTPGEDRWHVDDSARYWLTGAGQATVLARRAKVSFCLRDSARLPTGAGASFYGTCSRTGRKGISVGWSDLYQEFLPGQSLKLPKGVGGAVYCLWQQADPVDLFRESDETDNISVRAIRITRHDHVRDVASDARCT